MSPRAPRLALLLAPPFALLLALAAAAPARPTQPDTSRLAQLDGELRVAGLDSAVEVRRDTWGVPHIYARTAHDLLFAQGYVAAQDRLWQMEMWRRQGEGRLAEVLGPAAVARDRAARLFRYRGDMQREWAAYGPDARALVAAFVDGVNAHMAEAKRRGKLPIEFALLGFEPEPWTPEVPLSRVTPLSNVSNATTEVLRAQLVARVGVARAEEVLPTEPHRALDPAPGLDLAGIDTRSLGGIGATFADVAYVRPEGSNNWVVSGAKTATGKPILANDPHRAISHPSVRYVTHLVGPGWNVIGAGEPASPGVSIGHNERIAFGLTIVGMDQQDLYVEKLGTCAGGKRCTWRDGQWEPVRPVVDTIRVKGEVPRVVTLEFTRHGPIVSEDAARGRAFAVRSVHAEPGAAPYLASLALDRAGDWRSFRAAIARWRLPSENMIYADVDGNIGWIASGLMPARNHSGLLPVPGDGSREWRGFLGVDELPQAYNPREGFVATANNDILPPGYARHIAYDWSAAYRVRRIREVLRAGSRFTVADFERLQHDDVSLLARSLVPALVAAAGRAGQGERAEVRTLAAWDFRMARDAAAPLLFEAWAPAVARRANEARLPAEVRPVLAGRVDYEAVEAWLLGRPAPAVGAQATRDAAMLGALDDAVAELTRRFGADRSAWVWGRVHQATFRHPLDRAYDVGAVSRGGDANTVYATSGANFRQTSGASYRQVLDLADWDRSVAINVPGQSGQPGSEYYGNLLPLWGGDRYFPLVYSRAAVERATRHVLRLVPAR
jgi:penicillin amidase